MFLNCIERKNAALLLHYFQLLQEKIPIRQHKNQFPNLNFNSSHLTVLGEGGLRKQFWSAHNWRFAQETILQIWETSDLLENCVLVVVNCGLKSWAKTVQNSCCLWNIDNECAVQTSFLFLSRELYREKKMRHFVFIIFNFCRLHWYNRRLY